MLIDCRECGSRVSDEARRCPRCGCRGPSGEYTYVQDGIECTVNENGVEECAKCGQKTKHRIIDSYWEIPEKGYVIAKKKICKTCGGSHLWRSDWEEEQRREQQYAEARARAETTKPKGHILLWLGGIILPPILIWWLWSSFGIEIGELAWIYWWLLGGTIGWKIGRHKRYSSFGLISSVLLCAFVPLWGIIIMLLFAPD